MTLKMECTDKIYKDTHRISTYEVDSCRNLSIPGAMSIFQDMCFYHSDQVGLSFEKLLEEYHVFFVVTKIHLKMFAPLHYFEVFDISTWPSVNKGISLYRDFAFEKDGVKYLVGNSEWVLLNSDNKRIVRTNTIPLCENPLAPLDDLEFYKGYKEKGEMEYLYSRRVRNQDMDTNNHVNNVTYNKYILDCFTYDFLKSHFISDYEIHFINQAFELDMLDFFIFDNKDGSYCISAFRENERIVEAHIKFID